MIHPMIHPISTSGINLTNYHSHSSSEYMVGQCMKKGMNSINLLSTPFRAIEKGVSVACNANETSQRICELTAECVKTVANTIFSVVPESIKNPINVLFEQIHHGFQDLPFHFTKYGIPEEDTNYFLESTGYLAEALAFKGVGKITSLTCQKIPVILGKGPKVISEKIDLSVLGQYEAEFHLNVNELNKSGMPKLANIEKLPGTESMGGGLEFFREID